MQECAIHVAPDPNSRPDSVYYRQMGATQNLAAFVLAGGKSTRMGADKAFLTYGGSTLLVRTLELVRKFARDVSILGSSNKFAHYAPVIEDICPDRGPLGGIHAALTASQSDLNLMLAVDMPFVSADFLSYLVEQARGAPAVVTLPQTDNRLQPLAAIYRRDFAAIAKAALRDGRNKIGPLFASVETRIIEEDELRRHGFSSALFRNINTPAELQELQEEQNSESIRSRI